jgi:hypothetical protein
MGVGRRLLSFILDRLVQVGVAGVDWRDDASDSYT